MQLSLQRWSELESLDRVLVTSTYYIIRLPLLEHTFQSLHHLTSEQHLTYRPILDESLKTNQPTSYLLKSDPCRPTSS
jgi:hypothetical protein